MGKERKTIFNFREVIVFNDAYRDIEDIFDFIAIKKQQPLNAITVARNIWEAIDKIAENPLAYKELEAIPTQAKIFRRAVCMSWLIIFKVTETEVNILGLIHSSRKSSAIKKLGRRNQ